MNWTSSPGNDERGEHVSTGTAYDLITDHDAPHVLGTFEQLADAAGALRAALDAAFQSDRQAGGFASRQQMALALIRAAADRIDHLDQLAVLRTVRWGQALRAARRLAGPPSRGGLHGRVDRLACIGAQLTCWPTSW